MATDVNHMVTERAAADERTHYFVLLSLSPDWIWSRPEIAVNELGRVSYDGCDWHGSAYKICDEDDTYWHMTFHTRANVSRMMTYVFLRVPETHVFMILEGPRGLNALLVPKTTSAYTAL